MSHYTLNNFKKFITVAILGLFFILPSLQVFAAPLENGMSASYVLGQPDFVTSTQEQTSTGMSLPEGMVVDTTNNRLFVAAYNRILVYSTLEHENGQEAIAVLGATDFISSPLYSVTNALFSNVSGLAYDEVGQRLFVSDERGHRVLIFDVASITNGEAAVHVLGQADFTSGSSNRGTGINNNTLNTPSGLTYDHVNDLLFVADTVNNRVMVFDVADIVDGEAAVNVLGQADFSSSTVAVNASILAGPKDVTLDEDNDILYVADDQMGRVVGFDVASITNGEAAILVLGKEDFGTQGTTSGQDGLGRVSGITFQSGTGYLFVFTTSSPRVLVFDLSSGATNGMDASFVLGQPDFNTTGPNWGGALISDGRGGFVAGPGQTGFSNINLNSKLFIDDSTNLLYVSDHGNNRVLIFDLSVPIPSLSYSGSFTESVANDGSVEGSIIATLTDDTFVNAGSILTLNTHYSLTSTPVGLTPVMTINGGGTTATLTFAGNATDHEDINDVTNLTITFLDGAFTTTATANDVTDYEYATGSIDFNDAVEEEEEVPTRRSSGSSTPASRALAQKVFTDHYAGKGEATDTPALCPSNQIITQNLRAPSRNGVYNSYTAGIVLEIHILQAHLNRLGFNSGPVDGIAGPLTDGAIKRMQTFLGTTPDGFVGPITRGLMNNSCGSNGLQTNS